MKKLTRFAILTPLKYNKKNKQDPSDDMIFLRNQLLLSKIIQPMVTIFLQVLKCIVHIYNILTAQSVSPHSMNSDLMSRVQPQVNIYFEVDEDWSLKFILPTDHETWNNSTSEHLIIVEIFIHPELTRTPSHGTITLHEYNTVIHY